MRLSLPLHHLCLLAPLSFHRLSQFRLLLQFLYLRHLESTPFRSQLNHIHLRLSHLFLLWNHLHFRLLSLCRLRISTCLLASLTQCLIWIPPSLDTGNLASWFYAFLVLRMSVLSYIILNLSCASFKTVGLCSALEFILGFSKLQQFCMNCPQLTHLLGACVSPPYCLRCRASHHMRYFWCELLIYSIHCCRFPLTVIDYIHFFSFAVAVSPWASITSSPPELLLSRLTRCLLMRGLVSITISAALCLFLPIFVCSLMYFPPFTRLNFALFFDGLMFPSLFSAHFRSGYFSCSPPFLERAQDRLQTRRSGTHPGSSFSSHHSSKVAALHNFLS